MNFKEFLKSDGLFVLDIGNSSMDAGVFIKGRCRLHKKFSRENRNCMGQVLRFLGYGSKNPCKSPVIIGSVDPGIAAGMRRALSGSGRIKILGRGIKKQYRGFFKHNPNLGFDRLANLIGAGEKYGNSPCIVVDAGTAVTVDAVDSDGRYLGGVILAGPEVNLRGLKRHAPRLPLIKPLPRTAFPAYNTKDCLNTGAVMGLAGQVEHFVRQYNARYKCRFKVVGCGGSIRLVRGKCPSIKEFDEDLTLKGYYQMGTRKK
jgi:type III pantothenate kinase